MRSVAWLMLAVLPVLAGCQQAVPKARQPGYYLSTETPPPAAAPAPAAPPRPAAKLPVPRKPQPPAAAAEIGPMAVPATADAAPQVAEGAATAADDAAPPMPATADAAPQPAGAAPGVAAPPETPAPIAPGQGTGSAPVPVPPAPGSEDVASLKDPGQLIGLDLAAITHLLGQPAAQSDRPPAKVWSYNGDGCSLRVFVYPDINTRLFRALTYDIQGTDGTPVAKRRCFTGLVKQHAT